MSTLQSPENIRIGVFTEGWPGLKIENLSLLKQKVGAIDWHAPLDLTEARTQLINLVQVLNSLDLKLDAVVFGLEGESYSDPATARNTVGFAAPGMDRRVKRIKDARALLNLVAEIVPRELFVRGRVTLKGHFGAFDRNNKAEYNHLVEKLKVLGSVLKIHNALMLAETGCESAEDVIALLNEIGLDYYGANWDTANLLLWGVKFDTFEYARKLAAAGALRGIHIKGGQAPTEEGKWGTEIDPTPELIAKVIEIIKACTCFDGALIIERERFLPKPGDTTSMQEPQTDKSAGLDETIKIVLAALTA